MFAIPLMLWFVYTLGIFVSCMVLIQVGAEKRQLLHVDEEPVSVLVAKSICCAAAVFSSFNSLSCFPECYVSPSQLCSTRLQRSSRRRGKKKRQILFLLPIFLLLFFQTWPVVKTTPLMPGCQIEQFSQKRNVHQSCKEYSINL